VIDRRTFLAGTGAVLLAVPLGAEAQQAAKIYKIGILTADSPRIKIVRQRTGLDLLPNLPDPQKGQLESVVAPDLWASN
jgi:hypothetical protein